MTYLILVRHGRSEWNEKGLWTGFTDVDLVEKGREEARNTAEALKDLPIEYAYTSVLKRAKETLAIILKELNLTHIPIVEDVALNERDYGIYTGKNKWEIKDEVGEEMFTNIRRGWDVPIPEGESLKQVYERTVPYYEKNIRPHLLQKKSVIIVSSGNSLRALVKRLEHIEDRDIDTIEIRTGEAIVYKLNDRAEIISKEIRAENLETL